MLPEAILADAEYREIEAAARKERSLYLRARSEALVERIKAAFVFERKTRQTS
ncbi:MAG: hypothetical protein WDA25_08635 [Paracoccaceae bacterium]